MTITPLPTNGALLLIKIKDAAAVLQTVAGLKTKSMTFNAEMIDVTNSDSTGLWRELLNGESVRSMGISGAGIAKSNTTLELLRAMHAAGDIRNSSIVVPGLGTFAVDVKISNFKFTGEHSQALTFDMSLESSGAPVFTAES